MVGIYAQTLREQIAAGEISVDHAFRLMVDKHNVHPRVAARLLTVAFDDRVKKEG